MEHDPVETLLNHVLKHIDTHGFFQNSMITRYCESKIKPYNDLELDVRIPTKNPNFTIQQMLKKLKNYVEKTSVTTRYSKRGETKLCNMCVYGDSERAREHLQQTTRMHSWKEGRKPRSFGDGSKRLERKKIIIECLKNGDTIEMATAQADVTKATYYLWCKSDPVFSSEATQARLYARNSTPGQLLGRNKPRIRTPKTQIQDKHTITAPQQTTTTEDLRDRLLQELEAIEKELNTLTIKKQLILELLKA